MKDRIYKIMQKEGLSQTEFAEKIGVSQSNLSHIFGSRGQKPSLDVVMGIHKAYPYVNLDWLLYGEGEMEDGNTASQQPSEISLYAGGMPDGRDFRKETAPDPSYDPPKETVVEKVKYIEKPQPKITEIRIFFDNGTFEVFRPEKQA